jgi:hydrogenase expression/formation protein HypE
MSLLLGKLPPERLSHLLRLIASADPSVVLGPGVGRDCAVIDLGSHQLLVAKSDPITFASDEIGWYAVHVNANDLATTGATPRWFLATVLLPQAITPIEVERIFEQLHAACTEIGVTIVGGHTEVTTDLTRPIVSGTLLGTVPADRLVHPAGSRPGDALILTKRLAVEATSIIAREKSAELQGVFDDSFLRRCRQFLRAPGISVLKDAQVAQSVARVHAMHDPTEGGLATALHEMALAGQVDLEIEIEAVPIYVETQQLCAYYDLDPWGVIASGSLLLAVGAAEADRVLGQLRAELIEANVIGRVIDRSDRPIVFEKNGEELRPLRTFARDEIARLF